MEASTATGSKAPDRPLCRRARRTRACRLGFSMGGLLAINLNLEVRLEGHSRFNTTVLHDPKAKFIPILSLFRRYEPPRPPARETGRPPGDRAWHMTEAARQHQTDDEADEGHGGRLPRRAPLLRSMGLDRRAAIADATGARRSRRRRSDLRFCQLRHLCMFGPTPIYSSTL